VVSDNINGTSVPTVGLVTINGTPQYTVYACNNTGVHALNATDGSELWTGPYSCFTFSTEAIAAVNINNTSTKVLFTPTLNQQQNGVIVALDAATGTPLWTSEPGPGFFGYIQSSPAVATKQGRGVVVYATDHGNVVALNAQNGHTIWSQTEVHASQINSPMIANGVVYLEDANTGYPDIPAVSALSLRTGALLWSYAFSYGNEANPAVVNGTLYVTGQKITNPPSSKFYPLLYAFRLP
jgi:outer membrane protein assembly factor BamB